MSEEHPPYWIGPYMPLPPQNGTVYMRLHPQDLEAITQLVQREVQRALHPEPGLYDVRHFLTVEATDEQGKRWRGVLYRIGEEA